MIAQFLLLAGFVFSLAAFGDCSFAAVDDGSGDSSAGGGNRNNNVADWLFRNDNATIDTSGYALTGAGMITFEVNDKCYWYNRNYFPSLGGGPSVYVSTGDQIERYMELTGSDFHVGRIFAGIAVVAGFLLYLYSTAFCCSTQIKAARYMMTFLLSVVLTIFQGMSFLVLNTQFCRDYSCNFGRSAGFAVGALLCYFFAGLSFALTTDYPGGAGRGAGKSASEGQEGGEAVVVAGAAGAVDEKGGDEEAAEGGERLPDEETPPEEEDETEAVDDEEASPSPTEEGGNEEQEEANEGDQQHQGDDDQGAGNDEEQGEEERDLAAQDPQPSQEGEEVTLDVDETTPSDEGGGDEKGQSSASQKTTEYFT